MFTLILLFALVGIASGMIAGLFGLGGGVVVVPALLYTFAHLSFPEVVATHLAIGTSLGCIVVTAFVSSRAHWKKGAVELPLLPVLVPGVIVGGWLGGVVAAQLSGEWLRVAFASFLVFVSVSMFRSMNRPAFDLPSRWVWSLVSLIIGTLSSLFGVGGGSMTVPYLRNCGLAMKRAVATSAVLGLPIAISGVISYVVQGWNASELPDYSSGYLYWPAFLCIVVCSAPAARFGAKLAHRLPAEKLQRAFAVVLVLIAVQLFLSGLMV